MNNYQFEIYETTHNKTLPTFGTEKLTFFSEKNNAKNIAKNIE